MQDLVLAVDDPPESDADGWQPRGKQRAGCGIWYTRTTGIWQPVWLEAVHSVHVRSVDLRTDLTRRRLLVTAECTREADLDVAVSLGHSEVARATGRGEIAVELPEVHPWCPDDPVLYDVTVTAPGTTRPVTGS